MQEKAISNTNTKIFGVVFCRNAPHKFRKYKTLFYLTQLHVPPIRLSTKVFLIEWSNTFLMRKNFHNHWDAFCAAKRQTIWWQLMELLKTGHDCANRDDKSLIGMDLAKNRYYSSEAISNKTERQTSNTKPATENLARLQNIQGLGAYAHRIRQKILS